MPDAPMVSVLTTCYNQSGSVGRALDSVRMQQTPWPIQHVVVDDGSTDGTQEVFRNRMGYELHLRRHHGLMGAYLFGFAQCHGRYIALCDGDDYWLTADKLAWQVAYMEAHPNCGACFTWALVEDEGTGASYIATPGGGVGYDSLLRGTAVIFSPGVMIRAEWLDGALAVMAIHNMYTWDLPIYLHLTAHGWDIGYLPEVTAAYVKHVESFSNTHCRRRRLRYVWGVARVKWYFIRRYGCGIGTLAHCIYRLLRDLASVALRRWYND